ncbi:hypothetical protein [Calothrix sp. 336/3]|uniref:hypothetical protein n=1 Tax=Calothrix sp. 336/3 TaxID=1337936 RepID=UPI000699BBA4|nr:hypothetical protein [Calothrix sp. 336/3]
MTTNVHALELNDNNSLNLFYREKNFQPIPSIENLEENLELKPASYLEISPNNFPSFKQTNVSISEEEHDKLDFGEESKKGINSVTDIEEYYHQIQYTNDTKITDNKNIIVSSRKTESQTLQSLILSTEQEKHRYHKFEKILISAPNNFNPGKKLPPPPPPPPPKPVKPPESKTPSKPPLVLESIQTNFRNDFNKFSQQNTFFEPTFQFGLENGQKFSIKPGFNTFKQPKFEDVTNIPLQFGWQTKIEKFTIQTAGGIDIFNRLPIALNFNLQVDRPIFVNLTPDYKLDSALFLAAVVEHGPYKSSAQTLEKLITATRTGLNAYWQIKPNMSFFTLYRIGFYNDGNFEQQSFSRLEHKFGEFYLAGNLFAWTFNRDRQEAAGYFSPKNFLVYNLEAGWDKKIFDFLSCRLSANLGQQILNGETTNGSTYQARCNANILPNINLDLGYTFSSSRELDTGNSPYNNRNLSGQIQIKF